MTLFAKKKIANIFGPKTNVSLILLKKNCGKNRNILFSANIKKSIPSYCIVFRIVFNQFRLYPMVLTEDGNSEIGEIGRNRCSDLVKEFV